MLHHTRLKIILRVCCAVLMACNVAAPLWAEEPEKDTGQQGDETVLQLEPVLVTGRAAGLVGSAGSASQGQVGQTELDTRPLLRPGEVLEVIPGMAVTQHSGTGKANQYFLRGFNLDHGTDFSTRIDGIPVNLPTHGHGQGYMDLNFLIPELIDTVDFRKGPYYAEVGDFSSAGTADMHLFNKLPQGFVKFGVGQDDFYRLVVGDSPHLGPGILLYAFEGRYYDGPWDTPERLKKFSGVLKYTLDHGHTGFSLLAMGYASKWDAADQIPERAVAQGLISRLGAIDTSDGGKTYRYSLSGEWWRKWGHGTTRANAYVVSYKLNLFSNFTFFLDDQANGDQFEQADRRMVAGGNVAHTWSTDLLGKSLEHTLGVQVRHDAIPEVGLHKTRQRTRLSTVRGDDVAETSLGLYYRQQTRWLSKFRTVLGLRGDLFFFDVESDAPLNSGSRTDGIVSPKLSLIFGPWASTEVYVNGGFGFHSNDARGTTITIEPQTGEPAARVDPLVRSKGAEIGVRSTFIPGLHTTVAFWYLTLDSELLFVGDAGITEPSRPSRRYGVEWSNFYHVAPWFVLDADVAFTHAEFTDNAPAGERIPGALETVIAAGATVELPYNLFGSLRVRYFSPRPLLEDNSVRAGASTVVNLALGYKYKQFLAQLDVLNLFNA
ncbi:MAG TPA: TonB-dependent receptor plug domain-containing protein, partial [Candidatus Tectomicrobia bacterium]